MYSNYQAKQAAVITGNTELWDKIVRDTASELEKIGQEE